MSADNRHSDNPLDASYWEEAPTPALCRWRPRHLPEVIFTRRIRDLFRKRYWVVCYACPFREGPIETIAAAHGIRQGIEHRPIPDIGAGVEWYR